MSLVDWAICIVPFLGVLVCAMHSRKYVRGVVDYLAAGRVAGRYVLAIGDLQGALSVITLVALVEAYYQTGIGVSYWSALTVPVGMVLSLTGYVVYRFRETQALSFGQFLEMRYSRSLRIFAAVLRSLAEMLTNAIGPAIAAKFFIYFLGLPHRFTFCGMTFSTFVVLVAVTLALALIVLLPGGRIALVITDCIQGLMCYPIFLILIFFVLTRFSWFNEMAPVLMDRAPGESFLNPYDVDELRDFNIFALIVGLVAGILNRASWMGNDSSSAGRTAHEQKMAAILGTWRYGFTMAVLGLIGFMLIGLMAHENFAGTAHEIRQELSGRVADDILADDAALGAQVKESIGAIPVQYHKIGVDAPMSAAENHDTVYLDTAHKVIGGDADGNHIFQKFRTLYYQMMLPVALRDIFPTGMMGMFALLMLLLLISTDDVRIFNSAGTIIQDIFLPLRKKKLESSDHIRYLRISSILVGVFFFCSAMLFVQLDFINMFITIMGAIWLGGAGPVMLFGLYSRFGTTAGAFASIFVGSGLAVLGIILQYTWAGHVYPYLEACELVEPVGIFLETVSEPFAPYIVWKMDPVKFPVNSMEIYFISMIAGLLAYVAVSLLTCRTPYNLDALLHRGRYRTSGVEIKEPWTTGNFFRKLLGITPEYTRGDRILTYGVFCYSFVWSVVAVFFGTLIWHMVSPLPESYWTYHFFITLFIVTGAIGIISTFWFFIGGVIDMRQLFRDLAKRVDNPLDNGQVIGHVSLADKEFMDKADNTAENAGKGQ